MVFYDEPSSSESFWAIVIDFYSPFRVKVPSSEYQITWQISIFKTFKNGFVGTVK